MRRALLVLGLLLACASSEAASPYPKAKGNPAVCIGRVDCDAVPCTHKVTYETLDDKRITFVKGSIKSLTYDYDYFTYQGRVTDAEWTEITFRDGTKTLLHRGPDWIEADFSNCSCRYVISADYSRQCFDVSKPMPWI